MTRVSLPVQAPRLARTSAAEWTVALAGNPNAGKTAIFNALTGLRAKTSNFPGTTIELRTGLVKTDGHQVELMDLPGLYALADCTDEERIARDAIMGAIPGVAKPAAVIVVVDATNLERNLYLASQLLELNIPVVLALTMMDLARNHAIKIDTNALSLELGCPVVPVSGRTGEGIEALRREFGRIITGHVAAPATPESLLDACNCDGCPFQARFDWADGVGERCVKSHGHVRGRTTEAIDCVLTHPVGGVISFGAVMFVVFVMIFTIAGYPMDWIDGLFGAAGSLVGNVLPEGDLNSLIVDGVIGGVGGVLVFLPQICILFFFLALLEDTGYLARAAFVMDRLMRRVGLPGKAFVPMLSAHACAIPGIMAARVIEDKRDRLITILVLPLLTCSARIPVYAMVVALLFGDQPIMAGLLFTFAYSLGIFAALVMAFAFKRTILPGETRPLVMELPGYKLPSLRAALMLTYERGRIFVKKAGTTILMISVILWAASTYPRTDPLAQIVQMQQRAESLGDEQLINEAARLESRYALSQSAAGRLGKFIEPVIEPLGFDWQIGVGVISSFAAREVIVSTLAIVYGVSENAVEDNPDSLIDALRSSKRSDGTPVFTAATDVSLLIFYVLAMQCLPTQVITRRETGTWKWALFQLGYMTVLAYGSALIAYQILSRIL